MGFPFLWEKDCVNHYFMVADCVTMTLWVYHCHAREVLEWHSWVMILYNEEQLHGQLEGQHNIMVCGGSVFNRDDFHAAHCRKQWVDVWGMGLMVATYDELGVHFSQGILWKLHTLMHCLLIYFLFQYSFNVLFILLFDSILKNFVVVLGLQHDCNLPHDFQFQRIIVLTS